MQQRRRKARTRAWTRQVTVLNALTVGVSLTWAVGFFTGHASPALDAALLSVIGYYFTAHATRTIGQGKDMESI